MWNASRLSGRRLSILICIKANVTARLTALFLAIACFFLSPSSSVVAHGDEDHAEKQSPVVSKGTNMFTRVARARDLEVVLKHPPVEPYKELPARLFVTRFDSNEPIGEAKIVVMISDGVLSAQATAAPSATPGMYDVKLPPLPEGIYKLAARINKNGNVLTADYSALQVASLPAASVETASSWARTALISLALLICFGFICLILYRVVRAIRSNRFSRETAAA
jgi:hypothetical protein